MAELVRTVKAEGLEACATLGMLSDGHAEILRDAGVVGLGGAVFPSHAKLSAAKSRIDAHERETGRR